MRRNFAMQGGVVGAVHTQSGVFWMRSLAFLLFALLITGCAGKSVEVPKQAINPLQGTNKLFLSLAERMEERATNDAELARASAPSTVGRLSPSTPVPSAARGCVFFQSRIRRKTG